MKGKKIKGLLRATEGVVFKVSNQMFQAWPDSKSLRSWRAVMILV